MLLAEASCRTAGGPTSLCHATARRGTSSRMDVKALARDLGRDLMAGNHAAWATVVVSVFLGELQEQPTSPRGRGSFIRELYTCSAVCATLYPPAFLLARTAKHTHAPPFVLSHLSPLPLPAGALVNPYAAGCALRKVGLYGVGAHRG